MISYTEDTFHTPFHLEENKLMKTHILLTIASFLATCLFAQNNETTEQISNAHFDGHLNVSFAMSNRFDFASSNPSHHLNLGLGIEADFGCQIARPIYVGGGLGYHGYTGIGNGQMDSSLPIFAKAIASIPTKSVITPCFELSVGPNFIWLNEGGTRIGPYLRVGTGIEFEQKHKLTLGYSMDMFHGGYIMYSIAFNGGK